jgi:hypothetical protein
MKVISSVVFLLFAVTLSAQGPIITPLKGNAGLKASKRYSEAALF